MNSFIEFINRVPLLIESILVVLVPSSQQVYANTYTNEELENDELIVKTVSSDEKKTSYLRIAQILNTFLRQRDKKLQLLTLISFKVN